MINFKIAIECDTQEEMKQIAKALQTVSTPITEPQSELKCTAKPDPQPEKEAPKTESAPKAEEPNPKAEKKKATAEEKALTPATTPDPEVPAEPETKVDTAMCRALATKAIQQNKSDEVNKIVIETGKAQSISKILPENLPAVYEALRKLVG